MKTHFSSEHLQYDWKTDLEHIILSAVSSWNPTRQHGSSKDEGQDCAWCHDLWETKYVIWLVLRVLMLIILV